MNKLIPLGPRHDLSIAVLALIAAFTIMGPLSANGTAATHDVSWALDAFCSQLVASDRPAGEPLQVVTQPRDIIDLVGLHLLTHPEMTADEAIRDDALSRTLFEEAQKAHVSPPEGSRCTWLPIDNITDADRSKLVIRVSPLVENPYSGEGLPKAGIFLEFSLGGQAATLHWLTQVGSEHLPDQVTILQLDIDDVAVKVFAD